MAHKNTTLFYVFAAIAVALDQITKIIARGALENRSITVIRGLFDLKLSYNTGAAFGILPNWTPLFIIIAMVAVYAIVRLRKAGAGSKPLSVGLGLLVGGAIGNLIDRLTTAGGAVTDFLDFHLGSSVSSLVWPTFNFADVAIVVGALFLIYHVYIVEKRKADTGGE